MLVGCAIVALRREMGDCVFCGQPAGLFRKEHEECRRGRDEIARRIPEFIVRAYDDPIALPRLRELVYALADRYHLKPHELDTAVRAAIDSLIVTVLSDHLLTAHEEDRIAQLSRTFGLGANELGDGGRRLVKAAILRDIDEGRTPERVTINGAAPFLLGKGESIVWKFDAVTYSQLATKTQYVGGSQGVSVRLMRGVYYRVGAFKGERVETKQLKQQGIGSLWLTTDAVYFVSDIGVTKIALSKIIAVQAYSDGIAVSRSTAGAKPQVFQLDDPEFAANLIVRLNQM
jgi:hypothetical protein